MKLAKELQVSRLFGYPQSTSLLDRCKHDMIINLAETFYEHAKDYIVMEDNTPEKPTANYILQLHIMTDQQLKATLNVFKEKFSEKPGVGAGKVTDAMNLLVKLFLEIDD